jgi:hypothetical protein
VQQFLWSITVETVFIPIKTCSVGYNFNIRVFYLRISKELLNDRKSTLNKFGN